MEFMTILVEGRYRKFGGRYPILGNYLPLRASICLGIPVV